MKRCLLINDTSFENHLGCHTVSYEINKSLFSLGVQIVSVVPVWSNWMNIPKQVWRDLNLDLVVINGEGSIHHTSTNLRSVRLLKVAHFFKENFSIPSFIINATLFNIDDRHLKYLSHFEKVFTRESFSKRQYHDYAEIRLMGDLTISSLGNLFNQSFEEINPFSKLCTSDNHSPLPFEANLRARIPAFFNDSTFFNLSRERPGTPINRIFLRKFNNMFGTYFTEIFSRSKLSFDLFTEYSRLMHSSFYITGRFHGLTAAICFRVPFLAFPSNTPKNEYLLLDALGTDTRLIRREEISDRQLKSLLYDLVTFSHQELNKLDTYVQKICSLNRDMFIEISR